MNIEGPEPTKKLIVEVPVRLHRRFKMKVYGEDKTIKEVITEILELYTENEKNNESKGKK